MHLFHTIILLFLWNFCLGQIDSSYTSEDNLCRLDLPSVEKHFFRDYFYNNFEDLFPSEKMKEAGIKTIIIQKYDLDSIPTITVNRPNITSYYLNEEGKVRRLLKSINESINYIWLENTLKEKQEIRFDTTFYNFQYFNQKIHISIKSSLANLFLSDTAYYHYFSKNGMIQKSETIGQNDVNQYQRKTVFNHKENIIITNREERYNKSFTDSIFLSINKKTIKVVSIENKAEFGDKIIHDIRI